MSDTSERELSATARIVLAGLEPRLSTVHRGGRHLAVTPRDRSVGRNLFTTVPLVLVGTMAMTFTGPVAPADARPVSKPKTQSSNLGGAIRSAITSTKQTTTAAATTTAPKKYTVTAGDTVSSIASKFGLSTASVLALNGLGWKSLIHPGQVLVLSKSKSATPAPVSTPPATTTTTKYTVVSGDTVSKIAKKFSVTAQSVLTANRLSWSSIIYPGQRLVIPKASATPAPTPAPTPVPTPTPAPEAPAAASTSHVIVAGETISSIAKKYGVSVAALLQANKLVLSSIIYAGQTLIIPGVAAPSTPPSTPTSPPPATVPASTGDTVAVLGAAQTANAATIISVGRSLGVPDYGIVIALATAMQESGMRNLASGHLDSVGLFQQRPSMGWGTPTQLTTPSYAATLFYGGPSNPNKGKTRGLLDVAGWQTMTVTQAAQKVQVSGHPDAYARWETSARAWLAALG